KANGFALERTRSGLRTSPSNSGGRKKENDKNAGCNLHLSGMRATNRHRKSPTSGRPCGRFVLPPLPSAGSSFIWRAGGRPLTRRDDFDFVFFRGGLPFAVFAKGGPLRCVHPACYALLNRINPN